MLCVLATLLLAAGGSGALLPRPARPQSKLSRREWVGLCGGALLLPRQANAASADAAVTDRVLLEFVQQVSAEESMMLPIEVGLFGKDAPQSVSAFKALVAGTYAAPCQEYVDDDPSGMGIERSKQSTKAQYKQCAAGAAEPVTYSGSGVWRIVQGSRIDAGAIKGKFALRVPPQTPVGEGAGLSHDAPGLLSVRKGGGTFDFGITSAADPAQDAEYVVIGRVLQGMERVQQLDAMPVVRAAGMMGQGDGSSTSREKACSYGSANAYCNQNKPLKKITLLRASVMR